MATYVSSGELTICKISLSPKFVKINVTYTINTNRATIPEDIMPTTMFNHLISLLQKKIISEKIIVTASNN